MLFEARPSDRAQDILKNNEYPRLTTRRLVRVTGRLGSGVDGHSGFLLNFTNLTFR